MNGCEKLTDKCLAVLASKCSLIENFDIGHCYLITESGLCKFLSGVKRVKRLCVSVCVCVTDRALRGLQHQSEKFELLDVSGCERVSDLGVLSAAMVGGQWLTNVRTVTFVLVIRSTILTIVIVFCFFNFIYFFVSLCV